MSSEGQDKGKDKDTFMKEIKDTACGIMKDGRELLEKSPMAKAVGADKAVAKLEKLAECEKR